MIISKQNEISKISNFKRTLYEDWKNEDITREEYLEYIKNNKLCVIEGILEILCKI